MGEFSLTHWLIIAIFLLIFFGPSKLPQLGKSLGQAIRGFKKGISELDEPITEEANRPPTQQIPEKKKDSHHV